MNFIAATVELKDFIGDPINAYGLDYCGANAVVPANGSASEVRFRVLCYDREGPKLKNFLDWKPGTRALVTGNIMFSDDTSKPLDLIVTTIEQNIPAAMYCNQVVLGNAFFATDEVKERKNGMVATKIGSTLDNTDVTTWLFLETHEQRKTKLSQRIRKGRALCVHGYLREYRKDDSDSPYRAIVATDFTTRKELAKSSGSKPQTGSASGYTEIDPSPDY